MCNTLEYAVINKHRQTPGGRDKYSELTTGTPPLFSPSLSLSNSTSWSFLEPSHRERERERESRQFKGLSFQEGRKEEVTARPLPPFTFGDDGM